MKTEIRRYANHPEYDEARGRRKKMKNKYGNVIPSGTTANGITIYDAVIGDTLSDGEGGIVGSVSAYSIDPCYPGYVQLHEHTTKQIGYGREGEHYYQSVPDVKWLGVAPATEQRLSLTTASRSR